MILNLINDLCAILIMLENLKKNNIYISIINELQLDVILFMDILQNDFIRKENLKNGK